MGLDMIPAAGGSVIKSVQRGVAASSGSVTITAVNTGKTLVRSYSQSSSGYAGVTGTVAGNIVSRWSGGSACGLKAPTDYNFTANITSISGGTTDITAKECGAKLTNSTTLTIEGGGCVWEVIEFN